MSFRPRFAFFLALLAPAIALAAPQEPTYRYRDHVTKYEYMVPMRDGVKMYVAVYVPKDVPGKHPILMERTCYGAGPYGPDSYRTPRGSKKMLDAGYIFAWSDCRGKGQSEGDYVNIRPELKPGEKGIDESTDTYDTVDYLIKHVPDNNGNVGMWGISYPGFYTGVGGINSHPALKAISPQAPVSNWFFGDDIHHNGAFFLQDTFDFSAGFDVPRAKPGDPPSPRPQIDRGGLSSYDFFLKTGALPNFDTQHYKGTIPYWNELMAHDTYDQYWKDRALPDHMKGVKCAVLTVGGWFDAEDMWGALNLYQHTEKLNKGINNFLCMGPWFHGMWAGRAGGGQFFGDLDFGTPTSTYFQDEIEFPFFDKYLRGSPLPAPAEATVFETGVNQWRRFEEWPPKGLGSETLYADQLGKLATVKPKDEGVDHYTNDPANPTPYLADYTKNTRRTREYMIDDQRFTQGRNDVVSYQTSPLASDLRVAGPIDVDLYVTTSGTDSDFVVKVIDVWPGDSTNKAPTGVSMASYQQLLKGDVFRGKFRNSFERPEPFVPGQPTRVHFKLNDALHTFKKGHAIMIQIQSDWFPLVDRNPNKFMDINKATDADFQKATIEILHGPKYPTSIKFGVLK